VLLTAYAVGNTPPTTAPGARTTYLPSPPSKSAVCCRVVERQQFVSDGRQL